MPAPVIPFYDLDFGARVRGRRVREDLALIHATPDGTKMCGQLLLLSGQKARHQVTSDQPLTIYPGIHCVACGRTGAITEGKWEDAGG